VPRALVEGPLALRELGRADTLPALAAETRKRLGRVPTLQLGTRTAAWPMIDKRPTLVVDDGTRAFITGLPHRDVAPTLDGTSLLTTGSGELAEVGFDGVVRWYVATYPTIGFAGELADHRLVVSTHGAILLGTRAGAELQITHAFAHDSHVTAMRVAATGHLLVLGGEGRVDVLWIDGDVVRRVGAFEGLEGSISMASKARFRCMRSSTSISTAPSCRRGSAFGTRRRATRSPASKHSIHPASSQSCRSRLPS
jgi:hypothetical protein